MEKTTVERRLSQLRAQREQLIAQANALQNQREQVIANVNACGGAIEDCEFWLTTIEASEKDDGLSVVTPEKAGE